MQDPYVISLVVELIHDGSDFIRLARQFMDMQKNPLPLGNVVFTDDFMYVIDTIICVRRIVCDVYNISVAERKITETLDNSLTYDTVMKSAKKYNLQLNLVSVILPVNQDDVRAHQLFYFQKLMEMFFEKRKVGVFFSETILLDLNKQRNMFCSITEVFGESISINFDLCKLFANVTDTCIETKNHESSSIHYYFEKYSTEVAEKSKKLSMILRKFDRPSKMVLYCVFVFYMFLQLLKFKKRIIDGIEKYYGPIEDIGPKDFVIEHRSRLLNKLRTVVSLKELQKLAEKTANAVNDLSLPIYQEEDGFLNFEGFSDLYQDVLRNGIMHLVTKLPLETIQIEERTRE